MSYDDWKLMSDRDEHVCSGCEACGFPDLDSAEAELAREEARAEANRHLAEAAAADTHSSDVDPGQIDPWEER